MDSADWLMANTEGRVLPRRAFLALCAMAGVSAAAAKLTPVAAATQPLVLCNWGGDASKGMQSWFVNPYLKKYPGREVTIDGSGPATARIRLMVESKKVTWDVMDRNLQTALEIGRQGYLEKIDYSKVDRSKVRPEHANDWGIGNYIYAQVITYNTTKWGGRVPTTWKDVWDTKAFPGKRTFPKTIDGSLEAALMADGVPPDKLYPLDLKRALDMHKKIAKDAIYYTSLADSQTVFRDEEAVLGLLLNTRSWPLKKDTNGTCDYTFNQGVVWTASWMVPKGATGGDAIWDFINSTQDPANQVSLLRTNGYGPVNPAAADGMPADLQAIDPGHPSNYSRMIPGGTEWYAENATKALQQYLDTISA
jgi:putative spermidine/putrescine transport system substrate-binding protein